jgi:hypothetical protein
MPTVKKLDLRYQDTWIWCSLVVKALRYKPEGRGFDTRWGDFLNVPNPSGRTNPWGLLILYQKLVPETEK